MTEPVDPIEQLITDHDDALAALNAAIAADEKERAKPNPDPLRLGQLHMRIAKLQSQVGEIENDPVFEDPDDVPPENVTQP